MKNSMFLSNRRTAHCRAGFGAVVTLIIALSALIVTDANAVARKKKSGTTPSVKTTESSNKRGADEKQGLSASQQESNGATTEKRGASGQLAPASSNQQGQSDNSDQQKSFDSFLDRDKNGVDDRHEVGAKSVQPQGAPRAVETKKPGVPAAASVPLAPRAASPAKKQPTKSTLEVKSKKKP